MRLDAVRGRGLRARNWPRPIAACSSGRWASRSTRTAPTPSRHRQPGSAARVRRPPRHGHDADPRPFGRAGRRRDGRLRDGACPAACRSTTRTARRILRASGASTSPSRPGLATVEALASRRAARRHRRALLHRRQLPRDDARAASAFAAGLERIPLRMHSDIVVTSQMLVDPADTVYLLPARTRYEQQDGGTETTTERRVIFSPAHPRPRRRRSALGVGDAARFGARGEARGLRQIHFASGAAIAPGHRARGPGLRPASRSYAARATSSNGAGRGYAPTASSRHPTAKRTSSPWRRRRPPAQSIKTKTRSCWPRAAASSSTPWCSTTATR